MKSLPSLSPSASASPLALTPKLLRHTVKSALFTDPELTHRVSDLPHEDVVELAGDSLCGYPTSRWEDRERVYVAGCSNGGTLLSSSANSDCLMSSRSDAHSCT